MKVLAYVIGFLSVLSVSTVNIGHHHSHHRHHDANNEATEGEDPFVTENNGITSVAGGQLYEGDMTMSRTDADILYGRNTIESGGSINSSFGTLWPGNPPFVPYEIDQHLKQYAEAELAITEAIAEIERMSCITFRHKRSEDSDYILLINGLGCRSIIGKGNGMQTITLASGCWHKRTVVHELMHALGFLHEQSRPDRDQYVDVLWDNIKEGKKDQFTRYRGDVTNTLEEEYDYQSVMHYQNKEFAADGQSDTIQKIDDPGLRLGQIDNDGGLTESDAKQLNLLYKCGDIDVTAVDPDVTTVDPYVTSVDPDVTPVDPYVTAVDPDMIAVGNTTSIEGTAEGPEYGSPTPPLDNHNELEYTKITTTLTTPTSTAPTPITPRRRRVRLSRTRRRCSSRRRGNSRRRNVRVTRRRIVRISISFDKRDEQDGKSIEKMDGPIYPRRVPKPKKDTAQYPPKKRGIHHRPDIAAELEESDEKIEKENTEIDFNTDEGNDSKEITDEEEELAELL